MGLCKSTKLSVWFNFAGKGKFPNITQTGPKLQHLPVVKLSLFTVFSYQGNWNKTSAGNLEEMVEMG